MAYTITLPENIYRRAERYAKFTGRDIDEVIAAALDAREPLPDWPLPDIEALDDAEILRLSSAMMDETKNQRLSDLLYAQQAGTLSQADAAELDALMDDYKFGLIVKAYAAKEAVERGLRPPAES
jgi:hypothetical protein